MKLRRSVVNATFFLLFILTCVHADGFLTMLVPSNAYAGNRDEIQQLRRQHNLSKPFLGRRFYMDRRSIHRCAASPQEQPTYMAMDRMCEACHEMFRHTDPNLRAKCRSNCFDNDDFVFCFNHFVGVEVSRGRR